MNIYSKLNRPIHVVPYDAQWPILFHAEAIRIRASLAETEARLEHYGSTSVAGLVAKPVIDIAVGFRNHSGTVEDVEALERLGYQYVPEQEVEVPGWKFLWRTAEGHRYHVSLTDRMFL